MTLVSRHDRDAGIDFVFRGQDHDAEAVGHANARLDQVPGQGRIAAQARRQQNRDKPQDRVTIDGCDLDLGLCLARRDAESIRLTAREAAILRWIYQHRDRAVSRGELLERVWGHVADLQTRTVDMTIANLRQKIERDPARPRIIVTVKGLGYAWGGA